MNYEVFINAVDYSEKVTFIETTEKLDEIYQFNISLSDVDGNSTDIAENKIVKIKLDGTQFFKGLITRVSYTSSTEIAISGYDMSLKLLNRKMTRYEATNRAPTGAAPSIIDDIVSENQNGTGTDIIQIGTNTAYGANISFRTEYDNRLRGVAAVANALGWDWWVNQDGSDNDQINIDVQKGSASSVFTFIDGSNCSISKKERDVDSMVNWLTLLGYGDGINQLSTEFFAASSVYTTLSANCTTTDTTINCVSLAGFPAGAGYFKIGNEYVYGTKSGNNIGVTATGRGIESYGTGTVAAKVLTDSTKAWKTNQFVGYTLRVNSTDFTIISNTATTITCDPNGGTPTSGSQAYTVRKATFIHYKGCAVFEYDFGTAYTPLAPKALSPIAVYGIKEMRINKKDIIHLPTLEIIASKYMLAKPTPVEKNLIVPDEPEQVLTAIVLGDVVTLNDANAGFASSTYRVVGRHLKVDLNNFDELLEYEINDKGINFLSDPAETKQDTDTLGAYMNGATNIYCVPTYENCDATHPLILRFYLPPDAVALNTVKVSFKLKNYRAYETGAAATTTYDNSNYATATWLAGGLPFLFANFVNKTGGTAISTTGSSFYYSYGNTEVLTNAYASSSSTGYLPTSITALQNWLYAPIYCSACSNYYSAQGYAQEYGFSNYSYATFVTGIGKSSAYVISSLSSTTALTSLTANYGTFTHATYTNTGTGAVGVIAKLTVPQAGDTFSKHVAVISLFNGAQNGGISRTFSWRLYVGLTNFANSTQIASNDMTLTPWETGTTQLANIINNYCGYYMWLQVTSPSFNITTEPDISSLTISCYTLSSSSHTHAISYGIYEETLTNPSVAVTAGTEGAESAVGTYTTDQQDIDVTPFIPSTANSWYVVKFTPNKNMRIEANLYVKMFIQSK